MRTKINPITPLVVLLFLFGNIRAQFAQDSIHHPFQMSFVPFIGTDGMSSARISYDVSINILAGAIKDVKFCELGGLINLPIGNDSGSPNKETVLKIIDAGAHAGVKRQRRPGRREQSARCCEGPSTSG